LSMKSCLPLNGTVSTHGCHIGVVHGKVKGKGKGKVVPVIN